MSSTESTSSSESSDDAGPRRRRRSGLPATLPRRTASGGSRHRIEGTRTTSGRSEEWSAPGLTSRRLSNVPGRNAEQTVSEFLRDDSRPLPGLDDSAEARRQNIMALDRKRRLTNSTHDGGRRRTNHGGFHERGSSGQLSRLEGPSSTRRPDWSTRTDSRDPSSNVIDLTGSSPPLPPPPPPPPPRDRQSAPSRASSSSSRRYTVPRWQPDAEATECPICGRTFTWMFRRHHCRKCGRVVCNDCSPHRITIPRQYIVNPPGPDMYSLSTNNTGSRPVETVDLTGDDDGSTQDYAAGHTVGQPTIASPDRGAKVRLCNPCVPDPQPHPRENFDLPNVPQRHQLEWNSDHSTHNFLDSDSSFLNPRMAPFIPQQSAANAGPHETGFERGGGEGIPRHRDIQGGPPCVGLDYTAPPDPRRHGYQSSYQSPGSRIVPSPRSNAGEVASSSSSLVEDRFSQIRRLISGGMPPATSMRPQGVPPPPPNHMRYQSLDSARAAPNRPRVRSMLDVDPNLQRFMDHVLAAAPSAQVPQRPRLHESDICPICRHALPPRGADGDETAREAHIVECINARDPSTAQNTALRQQSMGQGPPPSPIQMVSFVATEKDCLGEDGNVQECSICMVEYDVGDRLARLECLCKFHRECIVQWFGRKQECPLHKIS